MHNPSIAQLKRAYESGTASPVEVAEAAFARIDETDEVLNAYVRTIRDQALAQAKESERAYAEGNAGPLEGVPMSIKDSFHIEGQISGLGSLIYSDNYQSADSGSVRRLREAGAIFLGKTNMAEFGQSATTDNRLGPDTANPWDVTRTPGGSSGGAAASVASGSAVGALAADGGGSIRIPAAFTGLVGLKPGRGRVADEGGFAAMSDFVSPGPMAWRAEDVARIFSVMADEAYDPDPARIFTIGWIARPEGRPVDEGVHWWTTRAMATVTGMGHEVEETEIDLSRWKAAFGPLVLGEEYSSRGRHLAEDADLLTDYERITLEAGEKISRQRVADARVLVEDHMRAVDEAFETYDIIATPATAVPAHVLGQRPDEIDGEWVDHLWGAYPFCAPFNVSGHPAIVVPVGMIGDLPVAVQVIGRYEREDLLLNFARQLESALGLDLYMNTLPI